MDRHLRKRRGIFSLVLLGLVASGCQHHTSCQGSASPAGTMPTASVQQITVTGGVLDPGVRKLEPGETISVVLARDLPTAPGKATTLVLIRQAPEGKTRQLIQLGADGKLMDPKQDYSLRNGDEIVFPGGRGSDSTPNQAGPNQAGPRAGE